MSSAMEALNTQALMNARALITEKFRDPVELENVSKMRVELSKRMVSAESQLNRAVQGKLDALKRSVDLMDDSTIKISNFASTMRKVDDRISMTNTAISNYDNIKRVHNVRDNLLKVISQVEYLAAVPDKVAELRALLESEPSKLREVFLKSIELDALRLALIKEIRPNERDLKDFVEQYLSVVPVLAEDVAARALDNISGNPEAGIKKDFYDLACTVPADLVMTFEVVLMHQEYYDRRIGQLISTKAAQQGVSSDNVDSEKLAIRSFVPADFTTYNILSEAKSRLRLRMDERIAECFEVFEARASTESTSTVSAVLEAGSELIKYMVDIVNDVDPCMPPDFNCQYQYFLAFEAQLRPKLQDLVDDPESLEVGDMLNIIDWIKYFIAQVDRFGLADQPLCAELQEMSDGLLNEYLARIKGQVMTWFGNIQAQPLDIVVSTDHTLITSIPEDMFNVVHIQLNVAKELLPIEFLKDAVNAVLQVLREVQRLTYDGVASKWERMDPETLCAIINDNQRMQEKCEEFSLLVIDLIPQEDHREMLGSMLEDVANEYVSIAVSTVAFLAKVIVNDLDAPVFAKLFLPDWEAGNVNLCQVIVATCQDYFRDISKWLAEYFYCKFTYEILRRVVAMYVMSLRRFIPGTFRFAYELSAGERVVADAIELAEFFVEHEEDLKKGGLLQGAASGVADDDADYSSVRSSQDRRGSSRKATAAEKSAVFAELKYLRYLSQIVTTSHVSGVEAEIREIFELWGMDGYRLVHAAVNSNPSLDKGERATMLDDIAITFARGRVGAGKNGEGKGVPYNSSASTDFKAAADAMVSIDQQYFIAYSNSKSGVPAKGKKKAGVFWT